MTNWERFPNAPIVEALLDLHVTFPSPIDLERLEGFHEAVRSEYPMKQRRVKWTGEFRFAKEAIQQAVRRGSEGFIFKASDGQRLVQARQDGFTFNWLKPYDQWEALRDEALRHWERYREYFHPEAVTRIGLRYINRIELPLPISDFREFIKTAPDIADGIPQGVSAFFMRLEVPNQEKGLIAVVTETLEAPSEDNKKVPMIFDIDVQCNRTFDPISPAIWQTLEVMREYKNEIFFASLTERAKEMFR